MRLISGKFILTLFIFSSCVSTDNNSSNNNVAQGLNADFFGAAFAGDYENDKMYLEQGAV